MEGKTYGHLRYKSDGRGHIKMYPVFYHAVLLAIIWASPSPVDAKNVSHFAPPPSGSQSLEENIADVKANFAKNKGDFTVEYISLSGRRIGGISEEETRLAVNGQGEATLFRRRGPGDSHQSPPGRFMGKVDDKALIAFMEVLAASDIENYVPDRLGPRDPINHLHIRIKDRHWKFSWGFSESLEPSGMEKLKDLLYDWKRGACPIALWSLTLEVDSLVFNKGKLSARLKVQNRGNQIIHIAHPASPGFGTHFGLHLKFGEARLIEEGYTPTPIEIKMAPLPLPVLAAPEFIELKPGHPYIINYSADLEGKAPRGWVGKFVFLHYLPEDTVNGRPVFNGALFTEELTW